MRRLQAAAESVDSEPEFTAPKASEAPSALVGDAPPLQEVLITVEGDAFVYKMVRKMVGAIVSCGAVGVRPHLRNLERGWLAPQDVNWLLRHGERTSSRYPTAPAHGLWLANTFFPNLDPDGDFLAEVRRDW